VSGTATVRNCLFEGATHTNSNGHITTTTGFCGNLNETDEKLATIEDCIIAVSPMSAEKRSLVGNNPTSLTSLKHILVLAGNPEYGLANSENALSECYFPEGYFSPASVNTSKFKDALSVAALTNGTLWANEDKWESTEGRFPMLRSFADSDYGKLLSLPIYTTAENNLLEMNDIMQYESGAATWSFDGTAVTVYPELELLEPIEYAGGDLNRTLDHARLVTRMKVVQDFQPGIKFEDEHAKTFCDTAFGNHDGTLDRCCNDIHRQKSFTTQLGLRRELTEYVEVAHRVDTRAYYPISRIVAIADLRSRIGLHPVEVLGEGGEGGGEED
jgi:hypothetical protein